MCMCGYICIDMGDIWVPWGLYRGRNFTYMHRYADLWVPLGLYGLRDITLAHSVSRFCKLLPNPRVRKGGVREIKAQKL